MIQLETIIKNSLWSSNSKIIGLNLSFYLTFVYILTISISVQSWKWNIQNILASHSRLALLTLRKEQVTHSLESGLRPPKFKPKVWTEIRPEVGPEMRPEGFEWTIKRKSLCPKTDWRCHSYGLWMRLWPYPRTNSWV